MYLSPFSKQTKLEFGQEFKACWMCWGVDWAKVQCLGYVVPLAMFLLYYISGTFECPLLRTCLTLRLGWWQVHQDNVSMHELFGQDIIESEWTWLLCLLNIVCERWVLGRKEVNIKIVVWSMNQQRQTSLLQSITYQRYMKSTANNHAPLSPKSQFLRHNEKNISESEKDQSKWFETINLTLLKAQQTQCTMRRSPLQSVNRTIYQNVYLAPHFFLAQYFRWHFHFYCIFDHLSHEQS